MATDTKKENQKTLSVYEIRAKVTGNGKITFLNGVVLCFNSEQAKKQAKKGLEQKYKNVFLAKIEIVKCNKKKLDFFIKQQ